MNLLLNSIIFMIGASLGSFALVVATRHGISSPWKGRSKCMSCSKHLSWYELVPVFSYLFLKGRCSKCKVKIGIESLIMELSAGVLAIITFHSFFKNNLLDSGVFSFVSFAIFYAFIFVLLLVIFVYDMRHKIVPLVFSTWIVAAGLAVAVYRSIFLHMGAYNALSILDALSGILVALPFLLVFIFSKGRAVGGGDIILYFGLGYMLGFAKGVSMFLLSVWIGTAVSLLLMLLNKNKYKMKSEIPFAPFIIIGFFSALFFGLDIVDIESML